MEIRFVSGVVACCLLVGCSGSSIQQARPSAAAIVTDESENHRQAGLQAAEAGFPGLASLCRAPSPLLDAARVSSRPWTMPEAITPTRVFDNLILLGNRFSSAWAVSTSDGLILIDALMNGEEVARDIEGGLTAVGLDPADIRYLVISHGHGDHSGGAAHLAEKYDLQIVMSRYDYEVSQDPQRGIQLPGWNDVPQPEILVEGEYDLALGDTTIRLVETPGHTIGTLSTIVEVADGSAHHTAVLWGGTGFNFGPVPEQYEAYARSAEEMRQRVLDTGIGVFLSNHVNRDQSIERAAALRERTPAGPHPFVAESQTIARAFDVFRECALAQLAALTGPSSAE